MAKEDMEENKEEANLESSAAKADGEDGEAGEAKVKAESPIKKILMFVVPLVILIGGGAGAYMSGVFDGMFSHEVVEEKPSCETLVEGDVGFEECRLAEEQNILLQPGVFIKIPDMIVNLKTDDNRPRFLKVVLEIELYNQEEKLKLEPLMPRVIDQFQMYLRELKFDDLKGTSGIYRMKIELLNRVRAVVPGVKVHDILFQEILVQ